MYGDGSVKLVCWPSRPSAIASTRRDSAAIRVNWVAIPARASSTRISSPAEPPASAGGDDLVAERLQVPGDGQAAPAGRVADPADPVGLAGDDPLGVVLDPQGRVERDRDDHPATSAATSAPSSQQASRSGFPGVPVTQTAGRTACQARPEVIDSTARTAPPVSLAPCTYRP